MEFLDGLQYWHWFLFGLVLLGLEVMIFGAIFLWLGLSAIIVGIVSFLVPTLLWAPLLLAWAVLSVLSALGWQGWARSRKKLEPPSTMNRRGDQYIGRHFTLTKDILDGVGELNVDDTRWKVVADQDFPAGMKVKVIAVEGTSLRIEEFIS